ncbi:MAG TPA: GNAT family N-acetyltransferase [Tardiphaga sp.]
MIDIRPFQPADLDALYAISLATGGAGGDASHLYDDPNLMGHIYSAPYALLEPHLALVAGDREGVAGFVVGAVDTPTWEQKLERDWWPPLRRRYAAPPGDAMASWTLDQRRAAMIHRPTLTPSVVAAKYPTHLHLNLLPRLQRRGVGTRLLDEWLAMAAQHGASAVHVAVNRANLGAIRFWQKRDFAELVDEELVGGRTIWMGRE